MGSSTSGASIESGGRRDERAPCVVVLRSFALWGATATEKVRQKEVASIQETVRGLLETRFDLHEQRMHAVERKYQNLVERMNNPSSWCVARTTA